MAKFLTIEEFLDSLSEKELEVTQYLRQLVTNCIPNCYEKLSYNVPYFKKNQNICFIWPASVTWGNKTTYSGVRFGFTKGYLLNDELTYLEKGNRKQVYWKDFIHIGDIDIDILKDLIFHATEIDRQLRIKK